MLTNSWPCEIQEEWDKDTTIFPTKYFQYATELSPRQFVNSGEE